MKIKLKRRIAVQCIFKKNDFNCFAFVAIVLSEVTIQTIREGSGLCEAVYYNALANLKSECPHVSQCNVLFKKFLCSVIDGYYHTVCFEMN